MALTAEQLEARISAIRAARDAGVLVTRHGDTSTQFRSLAEMDQIIANLEAELAAVNGESPKMKVRYIRQCSKGL